MKKTLLLLLLALLPALAHAATEETVSISDVKHWLDSGQQIIFLDTRNDAAWRSSKRIIPGAMRVHDNQSFARVLNRVPSTARIVAYCT